MTRRARITAELAVLAVAACGSSSPAPTTSPAPAPVARTGPSPADLELQREQQKHEELAAAHRKLEDEQQTALAATCDAKPTRPPVKRGAIAKPPAQPNDHPRCLPTCYATEVPDPRAGTPVRGALEIQHLVCQADDDARPTMIDELSSKLAVRTMRGRVKPPKKGTWQATLVDKLRDANAFPAGSSVVVTGMWKQVVHPLTHEKLRCVAVSQVIKPSVHTLDACGSIGDAACEAAGNPTARAINVVHYRLAEARELHAAGKSTECQQAALEAIAVARGLPRWRQFAKLNEGQWDKRGRYRTRFDGVLDEDTLFSTVATMQTDAEEVYAACGGTAGAPTTVDQEQSFHTCW